VGSRRDIMRPTMTSDFFDYQIDNIFRDILADYEEDILADYDATELSDLDGEDIEDWANDNATVIGEYFLMRVSEYQGFDFVDKLIELHERE
jgi:hypothetical protein